MPRRNSKHLTDPGISKIGKAPKGRRLERFDAGLDGLCLRVTDKGTKTWCVYYRFADEAGRPRNRRLTLGPWPALGVARAREAARRAKDQARGGIDPKAARDAAQAAERENTEAEARDTFGAVAERFIARECVRLKRGRDVEAVIRRELMPRWRHRKMTSFQRGDLTVLTDELIDAEKPMAGHKLHETAKRIFNWAVERGDIDVSPFAASRAPVKKKARQRKLEDWEIRLFWPVWDSMGYPWGDLQKLLLLTGQRRNEVAQIQRREIDWAKHAWIIPGDRTKNEIDHLVPLSDQAFELLRGFPEFAEGEFILSTTGGTRPISGFSKVKVRTDKMMHDALRDSEGLEVEDLERWTLHDLRRTVRTGLSALKPAVPFEVKEAVLNHAKEALVRTYDLHDFADEKRDALQRWADKVRDILLPPPANVVRLVAQSDSG